jgi:hypothetical protein
VLPVVHLRCTIWLFGPRCEREGDRNSLRMWQEELDRPMRPPLRRVHQDRTSIASIRTV